MTIMTTCIGAYPKPDYVKLPDWFEHPAGPDTASPTALWEQAMADLGPDAQDIIARGVAQAIDDQIECGVDIPTDGEISRTKRYAAVPTRRSCRRSPVRFPFAISSWSPTGNAHSRDATPRSRSRCRVR